MKRIRLAICSLALLPAVMPTTAWAFQSGYWHNFCMSYATYMCTEGNNLGYPYFSACGQALYEQCMLENGQGSTGGGGTYIPPVPICHPSGMIEAGEIEDPESQC